MDVLHPNIESEVLAAFLKGVYKDTYVLSFVDPGYFSVESYKWLVRHLKERKWSRPEWELVDVLICQEITEEDKRDLYRTQIWNLYQKELTYFKDAEKIFRDFIVISNMKAGVKINFESLERSKRAEYLLKDMVSLINTSAIILEGDKFQVEDWASSYQDRMRSREYYRDNPDLNPIIRTGIGLLDAQVSIKGPMIVNFLAPFKGYKSIVLNSMGFAALLQGYNVAHLVLENTIELTTSRYDSLMSGLVYDRLQSAFITKEEHDELADKMTWINSWQSRLKIIKGTPQETTIPDLISQLDILKERDSFVPDILILDYMNILKPSVSTKEERLQQQKILWDIKKFVDTFGIPCITATQSTQEGNKVNKTGEGEKRLNSTHQGKAIDISQGVDVSITINQTPQEKEEGIIVFMIELARDCNITNPEVVMNSAVDRMLISREIPRLWVDAKKVHG